MQPVASLLLNVVIQDDGGISVDLRYSIEKNVPRALYDQLTEFAKAIEADVGKHVQEKLGAAEEYELKTKA